MMQVGRTSMIRGFITTPENVLRRDAFNRMLNDMKEDEQKPFNESELRLLEKASSLNHNAHASWMADTSEMWRHELALVIKYTC